MSLSRECFERLQLSVEDLVQANRFGQYYLEHGLQTPQSASNTVGVAFSIAIVVAYGRPFLKSMDRSGQYDEPLPKKLERSLRQPTEDQLAVHERLLLIRNSEFAHSDAARHQIRVGDFLGTPTVIKRQPFVPLPEFDVRTMLEITDLLVGQLSKQLRTAEIDTVIDK